MTLKNMALSYRLVSKVSIYEPVDLHIHSPIRLQGVVLN
jgi:hypothetical protein